MPLLDAAAVEEGLKRLPGWERRGNEIVKTFVREDFLGAVFFVREVADAAEAAGHHPDIDIRWNKRFGVTGLVDQSDGPQPSPQQRRCDLS